jgi:hypothetical protein
MTQQEIQERNEKIAIMLGWKTISQLEEINEENEHLKDCYFLPHTELVFWSVENLKFHSDWNWLMEAVEFIQKELIKNNDEFCIEFYKGLPGESMTFVSYAEQNVESKSSKEAVFIAVSDFAKLYNERKL